MSSAEPLMKSTEGLGVCSRRDSARASASLDGGVSDIHVTCVHQSLHSSSVDVLSQEMMCHLSEALTVYTHTPRPIVDLVWLSSRMPLPP